MYSPEYRTAPWESAPPVARPQNRPGAAITAGDESSAVFAPNASSEAHTARQREALDRLQEGVEKLLADPEGYFRIMARFHTYSLANQILIFSQNPDATLVAGYKKWQELGRQVQKGERGIKIFFPYKRKEEDLETGEEIEVVSGFGVGNVFDVQQTEGEPLPGEPTLSESGEQNDIAREVNLRLSRWLLREGLRLKTERIRGSALGYYQPDDKVIAIRKSRDKGIHPLNSTKTKTLAHESSHYVLDHTNWIARPDAETAAEASAFVAMAHFGIDTGTYSMQYVANWAKDMNRLRANLGAIRGASSTLIGAIVGVKNPFAEYDHEEVPARG